MKTEMIYKIIGLIAILNICNEIYFRFGNHGWSRRGYNAYCFLGAFTPLVNSIIITMASMGLLFLYFTEW